MAHFLFTYRCTKNIPMSCIVQSIWSPNLIDGLVKRNFFQGKSFARIGDKIHKAYLYRMTYLDKNNKLYLNVTNRRKSKTLPDDLVNKISIAHETRWDDVHLTTMVRQERGGSWKRSIKISYLCGGLLSGFVRAPSEACRRII